MQDNPEEYEYQEQQDQGEGFQHDDLQQGSQMTDQNNANRFYDQISQELHEKLKVLGEYIKDKNEEEALNIRMYQLAICKILVFTHNQSQFILVKGHTQIGEAYLNYKCYEQAIDHLTIALKKNGKLMVGEEDTENHNEHEKRISRVYHAKILTLLGKCYLEVPAYDDSLELLEKAIEVYKASEGDMDQLSTQERANLLKNIEVETIDTYILLAQCLGSQYKYQEAMGQIRKAYDLSERNYGTKSVQCAFANIESSKLHAKQQNFQQAIQELEKSINMLNDLNYDKQEQIAEFYQTLSEYQEKQNDQEGFLKSLYQVRDIYIQIHGPCDKKVIKIKRQISINLLKNEEHQKAITELKETEEMEIGVYGEYSVQVAKTHKIIGTIMILTQQYQNAQKYLNRALKVFEENGMKKQVNEIKNKLKLAKEIKDKTHVKQNIDNYDDYNN